jgi:hypothetical protein
MSIISRIREAFGGKPALRNKPGGMAWINHRINDGEGSEVLVNRVVRTVRRTHGDFWEVDPPQVYTITKNAFNKISGLRSKPGDVVKSVSIRDECLTPIQGDVTDEEVSNLYAPTHLRSDLRQWAREEA